jgi:hypothetical protein
MIGIANGEDSNAASRPADIEALLTALAEAVAAILQPRRDAWTKAEAAARLACTESWLEEKARLREIPFTRLSGAIHFTDGHLAEITAIYEERPASEKPAAAPTAKSTPTRRKAEGQVSQFPLAATGAVPLRARAPRRRGAA